RKRTRRRSARHRPAAARERTERRSLPLLLASRRTRETSRIGRGQGSWSLSSARTLRRVPRGQVWRALTRAYAVFTRTPKDLKVELSERLAPRHEADREADDGDSRRSERAVRQHADLTCLVANVLADEDPLCAPADRRVELIDGVASVPGEHTRVACTQAE